MTSALAEWARFSKLRICILGRHVALKFLPDSESLARAAGYINALALVLCATEVIAAHTKRAATVGTQWIECGNRGESDSTPVFDRDIQLTVMASYPRERTPAG